jgi:hypothetical protein
VTFSSDISIADSTALAVKASFETLGDYLLGDVVSRIRAFVELVSRIPLLCHEFATISEGNHLRRSESLLLIESLPGMTLTARFSRLRQSDGTFCRPADLD